MKTPFLLLSEFDQNHQEINDPGTDIQRLRELLATNKEILKKLDDFVGLDASK